MKRIMAIGMVFFNIIILSITCFDYFAPADPERNVVPLH
jgi:hypothetical protein